LDIARLFVQQLRKGLDLAMFHRYIANHMTDQRSGKSSFQNSIDGTEWPVEAQRRKTMNRIRLLAIGTMLMFALTTVAQQTTTSSDAQGGRDGGVPTVQKHLKLLTEKLDLTSDQQVTIKPILQELHDGTQKVMQDESKSREERLGNVRPWREKADKKIREILNDDQKKKLDQLEHEPHSDLHGN
jgi:Spy/CpxP family protein refolding chaperone